MATGRINAARNNDICCITIVFHSLAVLAVSFGGERLLGNKGGDAAWADAILIWWVGG